MSDFKAKMHESTLEENMGVDPWVDRGTFHEIQFWLGLRPIACWGSLQRSPDPIAGFKGPSSKGGEWKGGTGGDPCTFFLWIYAHAYRHT